MSTILWQNIKVITMIGEKPEVWENAFLKIAGRKIVALGLMTDSEARIKTTRTEDISKPKPALVNSSAEADIKIIDGRNKVILPAFVNCHTHLPMTNFRSLADDLTLHDWLEKVIFPMEADMTDEAALQGARAGLIEMVANGTGTINEMYDFCEQTLEALNAMKIRAVIGRGMVDVDQNEKKAQKRWQEIKSLENKVSSHQSGLTSLSYAPHSIYTCSPELLKKLIALAQEKNSPLHIHVSETLRENQDCLDKYGLTPVELLHQLGGLNKNTVLVHAVHLSENDLDLIAQNKAQVVHCPASNLKLGSGIAPIGELLKRGINVSLGTDSAASNNKLDIWQEMNLVALIHKGASRDPKLISAAQALQMATVNGARCLGLDDKIGTLEVDKEADLMVIDLEQPHYNLSNGNLISQLVYAGKSSDVEMTVVSGQVIYQRHSDRDHKKR